MLSPGVSGGLGVLTERASGRVMEEAAPAKARASHRTARELEPSVAAMTRPADARATMAVR